MNQAVTQHLDPAPPAERGQIAALPLRLASDGEIEVLLVTSRETRRWIVPKGWPMAGLADHEAAGVEAREEAGVKGKLFAQPIGRYAYWQRGRLETRFLHVDVFLLRVDKVLKSWKEKGQRERRWFGVAEAADLVQEPDLARIFLRLPGEPEARRLLRLDGDTAGRDKGPRGKRKAA